MGNCLSTCTRKSPGQNGGELVISYSGGKIFQTPKDPSPQVEKDPKEFSIVQKELEALQSQISHSQAVLASLKFTFLEAAVAKNNLDKVHRTTQTLHDAGLPKSLEDMPSTVRPREKMELARSCPAIANIGVQTELESSRLLQQSYQENYDEESFLPPIGGSFERRKEPVPISVQAGLDLDIYRSCRKLSVLPEEEPDEPVQQMQQQTGGQCSRLLCLPAPRLPDQAHSFDSYLSPTSSPSSVIRQFSDPTPSARRPLQVATLLEIMPGGVEDSGLGSELRLVASPSPSSAAYQTPPAALSPSPSDPEDLSWTTPTSGGSGSPEPPPAPPAAAAAVASAPPPPALLAVLLDSREPQEEGGRGGAVPLLGGGALSPSTAATTSTPGEPFVRVPSRRRLVRSLARIGSEAIMGFPSESPPQPENMSEATRDDKEDGSEGNQTVFPNLSDLDLKRLGLWNEQGDNRRDSQIDDENIQNKYTSLVLALKTDKMTLSRRLELQNKLRDQAELNMTHEVETLKSAIELLSTLGGEFEKNDLFDKIRIQIEALYKSALRVSSTAEMYGAVQQENRLSKAVDIILKYVENLKHIYEKEKTEHEETRKHLRESKSPATTPTEMGNRRPSYSSLEEITRLEFSLFGPERRGSTSRRGSQMRRGTLSKNDSQPDILRANLEGDPFDKIYEGCETCGSRLKSDVDSNPSQPDSSGESSEEERQVFKRSTSFQEDNANRKLAFRQKFKKRTSFCAPLWAQKLSKSFQWLRPYEDFALQLRYFIASIFVIAAFFIVAFSFFQNPES